MAEKKSKWWLFLESPLGELNQIAVTDKKCELDEKITQKIEDDHVAIERLVRFYGRLVPIKTKQIYR